MNIITDLHPERVEFLFAARTFFSHAKLFAKIKAAHFRILR